MKTNRAPVSHHVWQLDMLVRGLFQVVALVLLVEAFVALRR
jgi:hypothetical protein